MCAAFFENTIFGRTWYLNIGFVIHGRLSLLVNGNRIVGVNTRVALRREDTATAAACKKIPALTVGK